MYRLEGDDYVGHSAMACPAASKCITSLRLYDLANEIARTKKTQNARTVPRGEFGRRASAARTPHFPTPPPPLSLPIESKTQRATSCTQLLSRRGHLFTKKLLLEQRIWLPAAKVSGQHAPACRCVCALPEVHVVVTQKRNSDKTRK